MIDTVKSFLSAHGLIQSGSATCNIIIGRSFVFEVFQGPHSYITVKVSRTANLRREFESQTVAYSALPEYVPAPLAFGESKGLFLLASEGVPHVRLTMASMRHAGERFSHGMGEYIRRSTRVFANEQSGCGHSNELERTIDALGDADLSILLKTYLQRVEPVQLQRLPRVRQHGDLVTSNLGMTSKGLVIFDWEDFGRVELPGFDIGILLASFLHYDISLLKRWFERGEPEILNNVITTAADDLGFGRSTFWLLLPVYLIHFLYLKKMLAYRPSIKELVRRVITELCGLPQVASRPR